MDETELINKTETLRFLEASILAAHMKFFEGNSETHSHLGGEEAILYETVIRYFTGDS
jgi:hypothetical protein